MPSTAIANTTIAIRLSSSVKPPWCCCGRDGARRCEMVVGDRIQHPVGSLGWQAELVPAAAAESQTRIEPPGVT